MSNHKEIINLIKANSDQPNILTIPRPFVDFTGSLDGALLLSQIICEKCGYELPEGQPLERGLRWAVNPSVTVPLHGQPTLVHDDRLLSAALVAEADRLYRTGQLYFSTGQSAVIPRDLMAGIDEGEWS